MGVRRAGVALVSLYVSGRLYVAGPMSSQPDHGREAFDQATARLRDQAYPVTSPVEIAIGAYGTWEDAKNVAYQHHVRADIAALLDCDGVVLLPGWEESPGARLEARVALATGKYFRLYDATRFPSAVPIEDSAVEAVVLGTTLRHASAIATPLGAAVIDVSNQASPYDGDRFVPYSENPLRHVFEGGGIKDNRGKAPLDLLPSRPLLAIANILAFGAKKYQPHNWRRGLPWSDTYASLQRHLLAWNDGQDLDQETGESHLAHAACQLLFLLDYTLTGVGEDTDNRFIPCRVEGCRAELHPTTDHNSLKEAS